MMKIPSLLYGRAGAVKARAKKELRSALASGAFDELAQGALLERRDVSGLILVAPERVQLPGDHFHCYALTVATFDLRSERWIAELVNGRGKLPREDILQKVLHGRKVRIRS